MRTSLNDLQLIEESLNGTIRPENALLLRAKELLDPEWNENIRAQQQAYQLIQQYGRQQLRMEIAAADEKIFRSAAHAGFRKKIFRLFFKQP